MLELLAIATSVELGKFVLSQVLDLSKPVLESYVQDFFKECLDSGVARLKANTLKQPMAEAIGYFIQRLIKELQFHDVPDTSINHHYESALKQFVRNKAVGSILGKAFETGCKKIDYAQLETVWKEQYQQPGWLFPAEDFDWRRVTKEYVIQVKSIVKADAELRALLEADLLEELVFNTAQLSPGFDLEKYRESLQTSYGYLKLYALDSSYRADSIQLWRMFIEQTVREGLPPTAYDLPLDIKRELRKVGYLEADRPAEVPEIYPSEYFKQPDRKVLKVLANTQHSVILGDPGSGKSTLLQFLALDWAEGKTGVLPLLIELRQYTLAESSNFLDFLYRGKGADWQFDQQQLHQYLLENPTLVMFDGLDEVFDRPTQSAITDDIVRFTQSYSKANVLVTSRIIGYQGYNFERFKHAGFRQFTIQALDETEIHNFIDRWYELSMGSDPDKVRLKQRLKDAIDNSKAIQNLADNPLLLTMMAILNRRQELPRDRAELYDQASRVLLYHWDIDHKGMNLPLGAIGRREKQEMLRLIAYEMQAGEEGLKGNLIQENRLIRILVDYLSNQGFSEPREKATVLIQQLRERNFILCYRGADAYGFMHRTFLEYFCAVEIVQRFEKKRTLTFEELRDEVFGQHWPDENWHEVLRLICGMLDASFSKELLKFLLSCEDFSETHMSISLILECMSEIHPQELSEEFRFDVWKKIFDIMEDVRRHSTESEKTVKELLEQNPEKYLQAYLLLEKALEHEENQILLEGREVFIKFSEEFSRQYPVAIKEDVVFRMRELMVAMVHDDMTDKEPVFEVLKEAFEFASNPEDVFDALAENVKNVEAHGRDLFLGLLLQIYPNRSETIRIIQECAENDPDEQVQQMAQKELAELDVKLLSKNGFQG